MDVTSSSSSWIYAALTGSAISSDSQSASISQHSNTYGTMKLDLTKAKNSANTDPFTTSSPSSGSSGSGGNDDDCQEQSTGGTPTSSGGASQTSGGFRFPWGTAAPTGGYPPFFGGSQPTGSSKVKRACPSGTGSFTQNSSFNPEKQKMMLMAHGIMAGLAFAIFFPFGAISIRLLSFPGLVMFHAAFQMFAYLFYIIAFGLGVYIATQMKMVSDNGVE